MEFFKTVLFGISAASLVFWVAVIVLWHTYMFPRFFKEDQKDNLYQLTKNQLGGSISESGLANRGKYSNKSIVIADFNPVESSYGVNRLYTSMLLSLGVMSFIVITYGLHSGITLNGLT